MFIMVYVRFKIKDTTPTHHNYDGYKRPFFPGFEYLGGGVWDPTNYATTSSRQENFLVYDNYTSAPYRV
jgi:hypothetical protein